MCQFGTLFFFLFLFNFKPSETFLTQKRDVTPFCFKQASVQWVVETAPLRPSRPDCIMRPTSPGQRWLRDWTIICSDFYIEGNGKP